MKLHVATAILAMLAIAGPARSDQFDGYFIAEQACPAFQSIRNQTNPGDIMVQEGRSYRIIERNKPDGPSHYRVIVPGVSPTERWVAIGCGFRAVADVGNAPGNDDALVVNPVPTTPSTWMVLAASWQPAFCETNGAWTDNNELKPECATQTADRFDATHFALHGLWPQPFNSTTEYCGFTPSEISKLRAREWPEGAAITLDQPTRAALETVMPGSQSKLEFHEWFKHGTCYGKDQQGYFADALLLMEKLNATNLDEVFVGRLGQEVKASDVRAAIDASLAGSSAHVILQCTRERDGGRTILSELQIHMKGDVTPGSDLAGMVNATDDMQGSESNCPDTFYLDAVGLQD